MGDRNIIQVLQAFKAVHRARKRVFDGDTRALEAGRIKINEEFKKYKHVTDESVISEVNCTMLYVFIKPRVFVIF